MSSLALRDSSRRHNRSRESERRGWRRVRLGEVLRRHNEIIHPGARPSGEARFVGLEHIEAGSGRRIGSSTIDFATMTGRKPTFRHGQIVYGYLRPYLNKVWLAEFDGCSSVDQFAFEVHRDLARPDYVAAFMRSQTFLRRAAIVTTTGQLPRIGVDEIAAVEIDLPPLAEQEWIATWLTAAMAEAEQARAAAQARLSAAQALPRSFVETAFAETDWPVRPLGDALNAIEAGTSVVSTERPAEDHEWGVLKVSAVSWGKFLASENKGVPAGYVPVPRERVRIGDLLISRCNTAELAGAVVLVRETPPKLMLSDKTLRLVLRPGIYEPAFLELALRTRPVRRFIEGRATGTSYSMRNISQETIRAIPVPTPPLPKQQRLVATLDRETEEARNLIADAADELAMIQALPASLLRRAFGSTEGVDGKGA